MFNMRTPPSAAASLELTDVEQRVLVYVAEGLAPKEISQRVDVPENELYRLIAWVLDKLEPAPSGDTVGDVNRAAWAEKDAQPRSVNQPPPSCLLPLFTSPRRRRDRCCRSASPRL
jgi:hypothetical protein